MPCTHGTRRNESINESEAIRNRLLGVILILLVVAGLKWSYPVTMPLTAAVFLIAAAWPIKPWLDQMLPSSLSYVGTVLVLFFIFAGFVWILYYAFREVSEAFAQTGGQFEQLYDRYTDWSRRRGLPVAGGEDGGYSRLLGIIEAVLARIYAVLTYLGLIAVLVILGLPEVAALEMKIRTRMQSEERAETFQAVSQIATRFRQYVGVTVLTSLLTGVASALWAFAVGLDLALTWGLLNFLLNFIPVVGNIVGIFPPALYAIVQFDGWTTPLVVFAGFVAIQITISNFVYPLLQGRGLSLPAVLTVLALSFWSWVWGVAGALLAVPLTAALVLICQHFKSTDWIAKLVLRDK